MTTPATPLPANALRFAVRTHVVTPGALAAAGLFGSLAFVRRLRRADWGECDAHDCQVNNQSLANGNRLLGSYRTKDGTRIWVIADAVEQPTDARIVTVLLPEEY